ncbi:MAG: hypothetical protein ACI94Y_001751 [Maribacter sp.]|jgi:hypothetical protein
MILEGISALLHLFRLELSRTTLFFTKFDIKKVYIMNHITLYFHKGAIIVLTATFV